MHFKVAFNVEIFPMVFQFCNKEVNNKRFSLIAITETD